jgi:hypothetical protein
MSFTQSIKNLFTSPEIKKVKNEDKFIRDGKIYTLIKNINNLDTDKNYIINKPLNGVYNQPPIFAGKYIKYISGTGVNNYQFSKYKTKYNFVTQYQGDTGSDDDNIKIYEETDENVGNIETEEYTSTINNMGGKRRKSNLRKTKKNSTRKNKKLNKKSTRKNKKSCKNIRK